MGAWHGVAAPYNLGSTLMNLPTIDLANLPGLDIATGLFGSLAEEGGPTVDDRVVVIMTYVYEILPPDALV